MTKPLRLLVFLFKCGVLISQCMTVSEALANDHSAKLLPGDILQSSATHFPKVLEAIATRRAAQGDVLAAEGAFDLVFSSGGFDRITGFWTGRIINTELKQNLKNFGGAVYGGYRISNGTFPIYEDINFTNTGGEFKIGALFSLLKDRTIDNRRFQLHDTRLALQQADFELLLTRIGVQHQALTAYWQWVAAGQQLEVYQDLLLIAESRQSGIERQVRKGALAAIFITENRQNILRRQRLVAQAERDYQTLSNGLSFFFRDEQGNSVVPLLNQIPDGATIKALSNQLENSNEAISSVLAQRPELSILRVALERAQGRVALSRNELKPQFDVRAEASHDLGNIAEGGISRDSTDTIVGFRFSVPLQRRDAKGKLRREIAKREALAQKERQMRDQIEIELRNILINLSMSQQLAIIARQEVEQAVIMQDAEQKRFAAGASDFFLVNIREERAADAQIRFLQANMDNNIAQANYDAATINFERLGLENNHSSF